MNKLLPKITIMAIAVFKPAVKNGSYFYCLNGSNLAMWDDEKEFMEE